MELKNTTPGKSREKSMRSRNKRKCKRKKHSRTIKRFYGIKETPQHNTQEYRRDRNHQTVPYGALHLAGTDPSSELRLKHAQNAWIRTYQRIVKWHSKHQTNYWKQCAQRLKVENDRLKRQMSVRALTYGRGIEAPGGSDSDEDYYDEDDPFGDTEGESSDECDAIEGSGDRLQRQRRTSRDGQQSEEPELDEEFLAFMEVSARHRLEHRRLKNESVH
uniref:Gem-associated protein 8 n=1 Tax=Anopheles dirus TaxID=7168 RepID=A0A182NE54_9DIPT